MKISAFGYNYTEPFSKDQIPNKVGEFKNNFYEVDLKTSELSEYFKNNLVWSPFLFEDGKRLGKFNKGMTWCLGFDYDDGRFTKEEIYEKFLEMDEFSFLQHYQIIFYESPRSGQEGLHKYRIVIPFEKSFDIQDKESWKFFYTYVCNEMEKKDIYFDAVKDIARMFYSVDFNKVSPINSKAFSDFGPIYRSILRKQEKTKKTEALKFGVFSDSKDTKEYTKDIERFYKNYDVFQERVKDIYEGNFRGTQQYKLMCFLKGCGFDQNDFESFVWNHQEVDWEMDDMNRTLSGNSPF